MVTEEGLFQFGKSKDNPNLPQIKTMMATLDPLGMPLVTHVMSGERADDGLYVPALQQIFSTIDDQGLLCVGDCKMSAINTRGLIHVSHHYYLTPLSKVGKVPQFLSEWIVTNKGKLILDATAAPADITYPNDLAILNQTRKQSEKILDSLHQNRQNKLDKKPRTYRKKARKSYLKIAKKRRVSRKERRDAIFKQLQYIKRNLSHIDNLINSGAELSSLSTKKYKMLLVIAEVYRQQLWMYENESNRIDDRIVSISQPHVRPIVRGKAGKPVEFERGGRCFASSLSNHAVGAKLSVSCFDNYVFLDHLSWDNFNESGDLKSQIEEYKNYTGYYPSSVHVDKIYRTRANRAWCKERGIRISGSPLGRKPKNVSKETKKQAVNDKRFRNLIEGKFGQAKRRYSLNFLG